jgi:zinc protease
MIRTYPIFLSLLACRILSAADALPTGEAILDKYIEVTGGKAAYEKKTTEVTTGEFEFTGKGVKAHITSYQAAPNKSYTVIEIDGIGKMEEGTDGTVAWERSAIKGPRLKSGEEKAVSLRAANIHHDDRWRDFFQKVECTGVEPIDGHVCYRVVLTPKDGQTETRYYDKKSYLLVRTNMILKNEMGEIPTEMSVSDYRSVDGVLIPFQLKQKVLGQEFTVTHQSIQNNVDIPKERFALPDDVKALVQSQGK